MIPLLLAYAVLLALALLLPSWAHAQSVTVDLGAAGQAGATSRLVQITALVTVLSLAPSLLVMGTAFTRIVIVLSLLRSAIGAQGTPPNTVLIGLALFLTFYVMEPTLETAWTAGVVPMSAGQVSELDGLRLVAAPFTTSWPATFAAPTCSCSRTWRACRLPPTPARARGARWCRPS